MLALSQITRTEMRRELVNLSELAEEIAAELQRTEPARRAEFGIAAGLTANGYGRLLRLVLENLIANAWKFTSRSPAVKIEFSVADREGEKAFCIRDNGAGFDIDYAEKLFVPFQRLHRDDEFAGTGIGLATVQRIILRHGGRVWGEGVIGEGATFYFTLG